MINVLSNLTIILFTLICWYLAGIGFTWVLLPKSHQREAFVLAPLMGMCLLILIGLYEITVFLTPLTPHLNLCVLTLISIALCVKQRHSIREAYYQWRKQITWSFFIPLLIIIAYSLLFYHDGFHLLVGGSDQLQYCEDARQILNEMHTGSAIDSPIPRQDHFIYDMCTRILPYLKSYRRGAEVLLATMQSITQRSFAAMFSVIVICSIALLGLSMSFLGRLLKLSMNKILILQTLILSSFYLLQAFIQGSFALLLSLPILLVALSSLTEQPRQWLWLTAIFIAADLSVYSEPALINLVLPTILLVIMQFYYSAQQGIHCLKRTATLYLLVLILAPYAIYSLISNALVNSSEIVHQTVTATSSLFQQWNLAGVIIGSNSYYDTSSINAFIAQAIAQHPAVAMIVFLVLSVFALLGLLLARNKVSLIFSFILLSWLSTSVLFSIQQDSLRFVRSIQYAMPFLFIGITLFAFTNHSKRSLGYISLFALLSINLYTSARTMKYIASHRFNNDTILLHFDEHEKSWQALHDALQYSAALHTPVLISGYNETIRPLVIAIMIREQAHVLGSSIRTQWPIYKAFRIYSYSKFNTRLSPQAFNTEREQASLDWLIIENKLTSHSVQAVVPTANDYPMEWSAYKDVLPAKIIPIANIGNVIYRNEFSINLLPNTISSLQHDATGAYRLLLSNTPILIHDVNISNKKLSVVYDGHPSDVILQLNGHMINAHQMNHSERMLIEAVLKPQNIQNISLQVRSKVKLRSISFNAC